MTNAIVAAIGFVVMGLFIAFAQKRRREEYPRGGEDLPALGKTATDDEVKRLAQAGQRIEAIKLHRQIHGTGLKESKDAVDKIAGA
jgi:ribosomal protein L7/L12